MNNNVFVADFETTTIEPVRVWLWGIVSVDISNPINYLTGDNYIYGENIESFIDYIQTLNNPIIYIHGLEFENSFLYDYLLKNNFEWCNFDDVPQICKKKFTAIIGAKNHVHYLTRIIFYKNSKKTRKVTFLNSKNLINMSVEKMAENLHNDFYINVEKQKIDYDRHNNPNTPIIESELIYNKVDCLVVAEYLNLLLNLGIQLDDKNLTLGRNAVRIYKENLQNKTHSKNIFEKLFVNKYDSDLDLFFRQAYRGGLNIMKAIPRKEYNNVMIIDKNSMYSFIMKNEYLPYGEPYRFYGEYKGPPNMVYIQEIKIKAIIKNKKIPFVNDKTDIIKSKIEYKEFLNNIICITSVELDYIKKTYEILEIEYLEGYAFRTKNNMFNEYFIEQFYNLKENMRNDNTAIFRVSKMLLETLPGKFGTNPLQASLKPYLKNGKVQYNVIKYLNDEKKSNYRKGYMLYVPIAIFVNAYAKIHLLNSIEIIIDQLGYENFLYCDTDSIHFIMPESGEIPLNLDIGVNIGQWKIENIANRIKYLSEKQYIIADEKYNIVKSVCAGFPNESQKLITWDNFNYGTVYKNLRRTRTVKGGKIIKNDGTFEIA